ncbi:sugar ABC transporter ATP-binding protein [Acerihabitans sp. TG2]|uniref:sugar ABC transporter ATP-binding protein n=1 Tax=Acerihabitans sp. TG2 TaxID=3096008 RepID=UPI002B227088|nr:sugar ABC transporter ATP-binding protein [Acerihabitans sp. TG2]MEA9391632.1 sugar ABC transporter ATP-binding protein [Acerihabitans sp. TG2]
MSILPPLTPTLPSALRLSGICKSFGPVRALHNVNFELAVGEIHALAGENGAGKSTLMNIIDGIIKPDAGEIRVGGQVVAIRRPADAQRLGIALVHQEIALCPDISIYENIYMAHINTAGKIWVNHDELRRKAQKIMDRLAPIPVSARVGDLSLSQQQLVEIAKALTLECRILILDEPTAALTEPEAQRLFAIIRQLRADNLSVIYISHRMGEIFSLCQRITIMRDGCTVGCDDLATMTSDRVITRLVGRELTTLYPAKRASCQHRDPVLQVDGLSDDRRFFDISFQLRPGEILGFGGLMGAGRTEIAQAICAIDRYRRGTVAINGQPVRFRHYSDCIAQGMAYLSEDRKGAGLFLDMPIDWNISALDIAAVSGSYGFLRRGVERRQAERLGKEVQLKKGQLSDPVSSLSGGNQQKVALAKVLSIKPAILFLDEPTRGVDISAKAEIYQLLHALAQSGVALVVISSELPELIGLCDRVLVIHEGRIGGEVRGDELTEHTIMRFAAAGAAASLTGASA